MPPTPWGVLHGSDHSSPPQNSEFHTMVVGEFTASNIALDEDKREEKKKTGIVDMAKLSSDVQVQMDLAKQGKLTEAVEALLNLEKMSRLAEDITATKACCTAILQACQEAGNWKLLEENVLLLSKRRSQLKQAVQAFVRQTMGYLDKVPDQDTRVALIKTLQTVTEGKVLVISISVMTFPDPCDPDLDRSLWRSRGLD